MGFRRWLVGFARGEISPAGVAGLRAAGGAAYSLNEEAEELRARPDWSPWSADVATQLFLVFAWNAFALQTIADQMLDVEAAGDTPAVVPQAILAFVQSCYSQVLTWLEDARYVQANPAYRCSAQLPAALPAWPRFEEARPAHVAALRGAFAAIAPRAEHEWRRIGQGPGAAELNLVATKMQTAAGFADGLEIHARSRLQLREARDDLVEALSCAYTLGQLTAMPSLVERLRLTGHRANPSAPVPLTAVTAGWPVVDAAGAPVGTVARLEGEPALGRVTGLIISGSRDRRARVEQIGAVERGVVRLAVAATELEPDPG